ncbi:WecB/TagA/CpsF family glycosyltransferase [Stutzerimonas azotifigens]|uniref:WecB/TagA/CpsF family glycosyltransferase n=1 Tax=Stutzerimonas azotifigens TaxID=291995 RepID=A0ABR5Z7A0_9GAMM|nr:WecB/TagA/CpsF family glycosyltransferase [Stutzerimonas azotifigens]MBA1276000.1 WecB/TagA/CpsF family glycosyltransferase [Stutzerimonas azotifigens]
MSQETAWAFGVDFYTGSKASLLSDIAKAVHKPYSYVVTPNVDHLVLLQRSGELRKAYAGARLRICDSRILEWLMRRLGIAIKQTIPGSDLTLDLLRWADKQRLRLVLIGATDEECERLRILYPSICLFHHNPPMGFIDRPEDVERCLKFVRETPSELVFYAVGAPRQEILASLVRRDERTGMGFCIGASISFATGTLKRAPLWIQRMRLEWLHRMLSDPRRLVKRYLDDALFLPSAYLRERRWRKTRMKRVAPECRVSRPPLAHRPHVGEGRCDKRRPNGTGPER